MIYDLHTHSNASDGILSPEELVSRAKLHGVTHLALTDHDTIAGLDAAHSAAVDAGLELINGLEFSCEWQGTNIHVVGLNFRREAPLLLETIVKQGAARLTRADEIAARLSKLGFADTLAGAQKYAGQAVIGRPHFARYLTEIGAVSSVNGAFKKYLGAGKAGDVKQVWPEFSEVCKVLDDAGGIAVLAHPLRYGMTLSKLRRLLDDFRCAGGGGLEVLSGQQTTRDTRSALGLAKQFDFYASCGSDFHVPNQPWQELGCFGRLPDDCRPVWQAWH